MILKRELAFFAVIFIFGLLVSLFVYSLGNIDPLTLAIRLCALNGYIALSVAAIMTPFIKEITIFFKKSFTKVHHYFAAAGLLLISLHPIFVFIQAKSLDIFLLNFTSLYLFFFFGGLIALILIFAAFLAALLRRKMILYWRPFHMLIYLALFVGVIHANLRGNDFQSLFIQLVFDALFVSALIAFGLRRWQFYQLRRRAYQNGLMHQNK